MEKISRTQFIILLIVVASVSALTAFGATAFFQGAKLSDAVDGIERVVARAGGAYAQDSENLRIISEEDRIVEVVDNVSPGVVSIVATKDLPVLEECRTISGGNDLFSQFFGQFQVPQLCQRGTQQKEVSAGSGFLVRSDGMIISNKHVVADTKAQYTVILNDTRRLPAKVLVRDPINDIAILKIEGNNFHALELGNSDQLKSGQKVVAIGNALGEFQNTVSVGVVSGLRRTIVAEGEELRALIQTDAAINPGNSGGPLINLEGRVIGVNTAIAEGAQSIGFALPVNLVSRAILSVEKNGRIVYPFLGIQYQTIDAELKTKLNLPIDYGVLIGGSSAITKGSPAEKAGLKSGDIIIEIAGERITPTNPLSDLIQKKQVGDTVEIKYLREAKESVVQVTLMERP